jgi:ABC-type polysaccharide/polyol phosphate export permease
MSASTPSPTGVPLPDRLPRHRTDLRGALVLLVRDWGVAMALTNRTIRSRYKRSLLGLAWVLLNPLAYTLVFGILFSRVARVDTGGIPYPVFVYTALVPWGFFSSSVASGSQAIISNISLVNKLSVSRLVYPVSTTATAGVDALLTATVLPVLFIARGVTPSSTAGWVVAVLPVHLAYTFGVTLLLAAVTPYLRDLRQVIPLLLQLAMLATPVAYPLDMIDERWHRLLSVVNPMVPVIDGYRTSLLYGEGPQVDLMILAGASSIVSLVIGMIAFERLQRGFADVA